MPTNPENRALDPLEECKHDVAVAAQEEREAQAALFAEQRDRDVAPDEGRRESLLLRWQSAAHALAVALDNLDRAQRSYERMPRHAEDQPPPPD